MKAFQRGEVQAARALFLQADTAKHAPPITYNIGRCEEMLDHPQAAVDAYEAYVAEAGEAGEYTPAASVALVQIKRRAVQLIVESDPSGANAIVDGRTLAARTPTSVYVTPGRHLVQISFSLGNDRWNDEQSVEANVPGKTERVRLVRTKSAEELSPKAVESEEAKPHGLLGEVGFDIAVLQALGNSTRVYRGGVGEETKIFGLGFGFHGAVGYAITPRFEILFRGFAYIGSEGTPPTFAWGAGPAFSYRLSRDVWIGGGVFGGQATTCRGDCSPNGTIPGRAWGTDLVFAPQLDLSIAVLTMSYGQWVVSVSPSIYVASAPPVGEGDNHMLMIPVSFGLRTF